MITYLKTVFYNPNYYVEVFIAYYILQIKSRDFFINFITNYLQLIEEARVIKINYKEDFFIKLLFLL